MEIAFLAGYESQQAFADSFKAMYKKAPGQYREEREFYPLQLRYCLNREAVEFGGIEDMEQRIRPASEEDIPAWMDLARLAVDGFPCWMRRSICSAERMRQAGTGFYPEGPGDGGWSDGNYKRDGQH